MADLRALQGAVAVLSWDHETYMPPKGGGARAEQLATLEGGPRPRGGALGGTRAGALYPATAETCGYGNREALRRAFQRRLGIAPRDYHQRFASEGGTS
jgi:hypothetical protein